jgi:hypothetical protein
MTYAPADFAAEITPELAGFPSLEHRKNNFREWYSWAVVASVVYSAGLVGHIPAIDVNKTDMLVETIGAWRGSGRAIRLQLKASSDIGTATVRGVDYVTKSLERGYYDDTVLLGTGKIPLFLVLIALPPLDEVWNKIDAESHLLPAAAWWGSVTEPSNGLDTQTVRIPASQRLDLTGLRTMLESS